MNDEQLRGCPFYLNDSQIKWVHDTLDSMDDREKAGQLFCLAVSQNDVQDMQKMAKEYKIGGYMCRALPAPDIVEINTFMQKMAKIPMLVAANFECGPVGISKDATDIASFLEIGATGMPENAGKLGAACAREGAALGANWSFAPVVDIEYNWRNPIVGTRAFGDDPELVAACAQEYIIHAQKNGMAASAKHFPGDGMDERDQHLVTSINSLSCEEWDQTYGKVYRSCIDAGVMTIMIGHIMLPSYSKFYCPDMEAEDMLPAVCAPELLQGLLREKLGFKGLIVTDATNMAGSLVLVDRRKLLVDMINAGCDMLLFTYNTDEDIQCVYEALCSGELSRERVDDAIQRILGLKAALQLPEKQKSGQLVYSMDQIKEYLGCEKHRMLAREIASQAVTLVKDKQKLLPISKDKYKRIYLYVIADTKEKNGDEAGLRRILTEKLTAKGYEVTCHDNEIPLGPMGKQRAFQEMIDSFDLILYVFNIATYSNKTTVRINWKNLNYPVYIPVIPTMAVSFANPYHLVDIPRISTLVNAYKFNEDIVDVVIEKLQGESSFTGKNPVNPFCNMWDTEL
ncbi:MAG: glycoside hydrolase family 3 protein [Lachnospiraceae bacterium]|nr:glycoside hydrolase family 3 protein [Lachnospiraceae bacterium]MBD5456151.1 glycoside hydrolase family 3 protein [Lachnospiraceae bacterium]